MKIIFSTTFNSNEYWDGNAYCLLEIDADDAKNILTLQKAAGKFLKQAKKITGQEYGYGNIRFSLPGTGLTFFDDNDTDTIAGILKDNDYEIVSDNWEVPDDCQKAAIEGDQIQIHDSTGTMYVIATSKHSSDYLEVQLPEFHVKAGKIIIESNQPKSATI